MKTWVSAARIRNLPSLQYDTCQQFRARARARGLMAKCSLRFRASRNYRQTVLFPLKAARAAMHHARYAADKDERFGDPRRISDGGFALFQIRSVLRNVTSLSKLRSEER